MNGISFLNNINRVTTQKKGFPIMSRSIKRSALAAALALTFCALPALFNSVQAYNCGSLGVFAFPLAPKQGDVVTIFVSVTNSTSADASYVVDTKISDSAYAVVSHDDRVVAVPANTTVNFQVTFATSASNRPGEYSVLARSTPGDEVAVRAKSYCATAQMYFNLVCNSNNCPTSVN